MKLFLIFFLSFKNWIYRVHIFKLLILVGQMLLNMPIVSSCDFFNLIFDLVHYRWRMKKIWKILSLRLKWFIIRKIPVFSYSYPYTKDEGSTSILSCSWCRIFILWRYKHTLEIEKFQFLKDEKLCWTIFSFRLKKDSLYNIIYISSYFMCCP